MIVAGLKTHYKLKLILYNTIPGITLYFLQTIPIYPTVHASNSMKPGFITKQKECAVDFSSIHSIKAPTSSQNLNLLHDLSRQFYEIFLLYVRKKFSSSFAFYADYADTPVCFASHGKNFLADVFNLTQISPSFSTLRKRFLRDL
jgi:hypothetical protein